MCFNEYQWELYIMFVCDLSQELHNRLNDVKSEKSLKKAIANDSLLFCSRVKKANMVMDRKGRSFESRICRFCWGKQRGF